MGTGLDLSREATASYRLHTHGFQTGRCAFSHDPANPFRRQAGHCTSKNSTTNRPWNGQPFPLRRYRGLSYSFLAKRMNCGPRHSTPKGLWSASHAIIIPSHSSICVTREQATSSGSLTAFPTSPGDRTASQWTPCAGMWRKPTSKCIR
jgi:hypothetical protein